MKKNIYIYIRVAPTLALCFFVSSLAVSYLSKFLSAHFFFLPIFFSRSPTCLSSNYSSLLPILSLFLYNFFFLKILHLCYPYALCTCKCWWELLKLDLDVVLFLCLGSCSYCFRNYGYDPNPKHPKTPNFPPTLLLITESIIPTF